MTPIGWLMVITGATLLILLLAVFGLIDLVT